MARPERWGGAGREGWGSTASPGDRWGSRRAEGQAGGEPAKRGRGRTPPARLAPPGASLPGCPPRAPMPVQQAGEAEEWAWAWAPPPLLGATPAFQPLLCSPDRLPSEAPRPRAGEDGGSPRAPMAAGLALALAALLGGWLCAAGLAQGLDDEDGALISAPPELLEKLPAAAKATVAAGYVNPSEAEAAATKELPRLPATPAGMPLAGSPTHETVLIVGDTRYAWQEWSAWHCNCAAGSMARVRDITYAAPDVRLDPAQYDLLRFERLVCSYALCACSRQKRQCDLLAPACDLGQMHLCALRDIQRDQNEKRRRFWAKVNSGLKALWRSLKEAFPSDEKVRREPGGLGRTLHMLRGRVPFR